MKKAKAPTAPKSKLPMKLVKTDKPMKSPKGSKPKKMKGSC